MKKLVLSLKKAVLPIAGLLVALTSIPEASATPAFARQAGKACNTCHFQHYPALNDYGMEFKAGGYTDMGKQGTIKGKDISLPEILNASFFTKVRYQKSSGTDIPGQPTVASGQLQFPDEFALLFGGRITDNVGFMLEGQLADQAAAFVAGFKMPFMFKAAGMKYGVVPYTTDGLGAAYGFELLNTGAVRNVRILEHRAESSAAQYLGTDGAASGAAFVLWHPQFFANFTKWSPNHVATGNGNASRVPTSNYLRAAWTPTFGDWSAGLGVQSWSGQSNVGGAGVTTATLTKATVIDAQLQGAIGNFPVGFYLGHGTVPGSPAGAAVANRFNANPNTEKATTLTGELGIIPNKLTLSLALRNANTGALVNGTDNATTFGARYAYSQNIGFHIEHSKRSKNGAVGRYAGNLTAGDSQTTFMMSAGF